MKHKSISLILCLVLLLQIGLPMAAAEEKYRTVQIYQLDGEAEVLRDAKGITPYLNMMLENEDHVSTYSESWLYLKMDADKYVLAEPETSFSLEAVGSGTRTRTVIRLEQGAVVSHITDPLRDGSSYEVVTPNSTMAVRGTSFRVFVWFGPDGWSHTVLQVFEGSVAVRLLYPDGSQSDKLRRFQSGESAYIWGNNSTSDYEQGPVEIRYLTMRARTLEFLEIGLSELDDFSITKEDLERAKQNAEILEELFPLFHHKRASGMAEIAKTATSGDMLDEDSLPDGEGSRATVVTPNGRPRQGPFGN